MPLAAIYRHGLDQDTAALRDSLCPAAADISESKPDGSHNLAMDIEKGLNSLHCMSTAVHGQ